MAAQNTSPYLADLERDGFVVIKSIISQEQLDTLRAASRTVEHLARSGQWPHIRTVGKQFPPWESTPPPGRGIWGVQHLLHPALPGHDAFASAYFSEAVLGVARELLRCGDGDLVMELLNMLVRPDADFALRWHRDDIPPGASPEEEEARLARPAFHAQYNLALWEDESLELVPGSHWRARTAAEREAAEGEGEGMPGRTVVRLGPGDAAFYDSNILHRGVYDAARERVTLHGSVGHKAGSGLRARNVLQHGVGAWVGQVDFATLGEGERERAEGMRERLVRMGSVSGDVGYSLEG